MWLKELVNRSTRRTPLGRRPRSSAARRRGLRPSLERLEDRTVPSGGTLLASGLEGAAGSTVGPDGALYVTEGAAGRITRVDPSTGAKATFASGLPRSIIGIGGAIDVAFLDHTAYTLVTLVGPDVGGHDAVGVYRVDGPSSFTVVADIGAFALAHPPHTDFFVPTGLQYALEPYHGGFLVTDGHHNRVLRATLDGQVSDFITFDNIVPTGLALWGNTVYMAEAGPVPHLPENGKVVAFGPQSPAPTVVAAGAPLLVDVEFGPGRTLYGLSQGHWDGPFAGTPAEPNTGALVRANPNGTFTAVAAGLDRPTSLEFIGRTAYVVTLTGEVWKMDGAASPAPDEGHGLGSFANVLGGSLTVSRSTPGGTPTAVGNGGTAAALTVLGGTTTGNRATGGAGAATGDGRLVAPAGTANADLLTWVFARDAWAGDNPFGDLNLL